MLSVINGAIYHTSAYTAEDIYHIAQDFFFNGEHDSDLIAFDDFCDEPIYVSRTDVEKKMIDEDCFVHFSYRMFKDARRNAHIKAGGIVPVLDELGNPVFLLRAMGQVGYSHIYEEITDAPDGRVFLLYQNLVLTDLTEYAFILLRDVLCDYAGRIFCVGADWTDLKRLLPDTDIMVVKDETELPAELSSQETMYLSNFQSFMAGYEERCAKGHFSYDEIMVLVYFFAYRKSFGNGNPDKKYYLIDPVFPMEGLMSICDKVQDVYAYAEANGYIPVMHLTQSNGTMYSDYDGDDIWKKFFIQPYGSSAESYRNAQNIWNFPFATVTFSDRWLMKRIVDYKMPSFINLNYINQQVKAEVDKIRPAVLPCPDRTIGVLIRGTDYTSTHLPGHSIMASPEQVLEKVQEFEMDEKFDYIFLSTEDEDVLERMKELCGERLCYIDQKRFRLNRGELLSSQKKEREQEGWLKGKEYLTTLKLLTECSAFIASGSCCGTTCVLNSGAEHFSRCNVFNLGTV